MIRRIMAGSLALLFIFAAAYATNSCKVTVTNQSSDTMAAIGFSQPIAHSLSNTVNPGSSSVLVLKQSVAELFVDFLPPGQTEHTGEIIRAQMARHIDCDSNRPIHVAIQLDRGDAYPSMTIRY